MIQDIDQIEMQKLNDIYVYTHTESARTKAFFSNLNADIEKIIDNVVSDENERIAGRTVAIRRRKTGPGKGSHHNMMQMASKLKQSEAFRKVRKDQILTRTEKKEKSQALQRVPKEECTTRMVV